MLFFIIENPKMQSLLMLKGFKLKKYKKELSIVIKNVIGSGDTLMHKAEHPSNYFFQYFHI